MLGATVLPRRPGLSPSEATSAPADFDPAAVDRFVRSELHWSRVPGAAVVIVEGDRTVYARGFGRDVTARSRFRLGSSSKQFTALAVMQLAEQGRLSLDAPVVQYVPWFRVGDAGAGAAITVRELLTHTSGISHEDGLRLLGGDGRRDVAAVVRGLRTAAIRHRPGTHYEYSNANYEILGLVVEATAGQPYDDYMADHVFAPLGMVDTSVADSGPLAPGYHSWFGLPIPTRSPYLRSAVPAGFVATTAVDLGRYLAAQLNGDAPTVSPAGLAELRRPAVPTGRSSGGVPEMYAMGWFSGQYAGESAVWHHGNAFISSSTIAVLREHHAAVAVLADTPMSLSLPSDRIAQGIVRIMRGEKPNRAGWKANAIVLQFDTLLFVFAMFAIELVRAMTRTKGIALVVAAAASVLLAVAAVSALRGTVGRSLAFSWREWPDATLVIYGGSLVLAAMAVARLAVGVAPWRWRRRGAL